MTIQTILKRLTFAGLTAFISFFLFFQPVSAQVFYFNPTSTPAPTTGAVPTGGLVLPTNTPIPTNTPSAGTSVTVLPMSITPTGPVNIIPQEGKTGVYVDNATDTAIVKDGTRVYIGGLFTQVKFGTGEAVLRDRLAALDLTNQNVLPWNPSPNNIVEALAVDENSIYVGGRFTEIDKQPRAFIASFDKATLTLTSWRPDANDQVNALHADANKIWVAGRFTAIAGENRLRLVAFSKPNYALDASNLDANNEIFTMAGNETTLFVGGAFTEIAGVKRNYIAAIDKATGKVTEWNPQLNNEVRSISLVDNKVVVNGPFTRVNDAEAVNYTAVIDPATGAVTSLQPLNAQGTPLPGTTTTLTIKIDEQALGFKIPNLAQILTFIIRMFFVIAGLLALFYLLLGALEWVTSGGDEEKTGAARKKIVAAVIGLILVVVVLAVVVTLEQIVFRGKICVGLSCAASIPSLIEPLP